jgi:3-phenylpropionate/trans-cinnamate dioxygenase ferredoxin reductase component
MDIVIAGAGACGGRAAAALREEGFTGSVTLIGDEAEPPYERPPLSKAALVADHPSTSTLYDAARLAELEITFIGGAAVCAIDRDCAEVVLADGTAHRYDRLLLATGARPRPLAVPGGEHALVLRTTADAARLRAALVPGAHVGVVGGGFIGLEVAASARARGCRVTVVEIAPSVMGRVVPPELAAIMAARHLAAGVELCCGVGIERIESEPARIVLEDGRTVVADVVVAGVGALPNTALAETAGLEVDNGIAVDRCLRTSDASIFAAGDCCSFPHPVYRRIRLEAWRNAIDQAEVVARNLLGANEAYERIPWFWSDQYELGLHIAGLPSAATEEVLRVRPDGAVLRFGLDADGRLVAASAVAEGTGIAKDIRLAELLIAGGARPDPALLADPAASLKALSREI